MVTQENETWDDSPETTTKDSATTEAPDGAAAPAEADLPDGAEKPGADAGVDSGNTASEANAVAESAVEAAPSAPVFDPDAPHVTHVSPHGRRLLQGGNLFSTVGKTFISSWEG